MLAAFIGAPFFIWPCLRLGEIEDLARRGMAVMLSTHDPDHAFLCAHQVALLHQGRLARLGPPDEVITRESLREVYGVEVTVMEVARAEGRVARVCVPGRSGSDGARRTTRTPSVSPDSISALRLSLQVAVLATALNALVGIPLAYLLARRRFWGRASSTCW